MNAWSVFHARTNDKITRKAGNKTRRDLALSIAAILC
jgi:hypothetical protein